jgi:hypothetical protein
MDGNNIIFSNKLLTLYSNVIIMWNMKIFGVTRVLILYNNAIVIWNMIN